MQLAASMIILLLSLCVDDGTETMKREGVLIKNIFQITPLAYYDESTR